MRPDFDIGRGTLWRFSGLAREGARELCNFAPVTGASSS